MRSRSAISATLVAFTSPWTLVAADPPLEAPASLSSARFPALASARPAQSPPERNVEGIMDNSFLVEEAYNQEPGVVQHIFNAVYGWNRLRGPDEHRLDFVFTQ